jgi:hypothetical protein
MRFYPLFFYLVATAWLTVLRDSALSFLPAVVVIATMIYWLWRIRSRASGVGRTAVISSLPRA